jgi:hypothetical protein
VGLRMHKALLLHPLHIFKEWFEEQREKKKDSDKKQNQGRK